MYERKRGVGVHRKVTGNCLPPTNWMMSLRCSEDKAESKIIFKDLKHKRRERFKTDFVFQG